MKKYQEASEILGRIKRSNKVLLSLHKNPDPDSIGANLSFCQFLKNSGKKVEVISPDKTASRFSVFPNLRSIEQKDIAKIDPSGFDLYVALDSAVLGMVTYNKDLQLAKDKIINIDHHITNTRFGSVNLVDGEVGSCCEVLYCLFSQWGVVIDPKMATNLMLGIAGDTGMFRYSTGVTSQTLKVAQILYDKGADFEKICLSLYQSTPLETLKYWGVVLNGLEIKQAGKYNFAFRANTFEEIQKVARPGFVYGAASVFFQTVEETEFGLLITEEEKGVLGGSLRSRTDVDVAKIATALGGGGHKAAAGFTYELNDKSFQEGIEDILNRVGKVLENVENN